MLKTIANMGTLMAEEQALHRGKVAPAFEMFRAAQAVTERGARDIFEEEWMQPLFEVLNEEMDAVMRDRNTRRPAAGRWLKTLRSVLVEEIKNLRSVEIKLMQTLPKMTRAAQEKSLGDAFEDQLELAKEHGQRLDEAAEMIGISAKGRACVVMESFVSGIKEVIAENPAGSARDFSLVSAALKVEDYKIVCYGCARTFAQILGLSEAAALLEASYQEEVSLHAKLEYLGEYVRPNEEGFRT